MCKYVSMHMCIYVRVCKCACISVCVRVCAYMLMCTWIWVLMEVRDFSLPAADLRWLWGLGTEPGCPVRAVCSLIH